MSIAHLVQFWYYNLCYLEPLYGKINPEIKISKNRSMRSEKSKKYHDNNDGLTLHPWFLDSILSTSSHLSEISVEYTSLNHCRRKVIDWLNKLWDLRILTSIPRKDGWSPVCTSPGAVFPSHSSFQMMINLANKEVPNRKENTDW